MQKLILIILLYIFVPHLLSEQITNSEYLKNFSLDTDGKNYKLISQNCHPNFYLHNIRRNIQYHH